MLKLDRLSSAKLGVSTSTSLDPMCMPNGEDN